MSKAYKLKIKKIPLGEEIPSHSIKFKPFQDLYLDLLENKEKLKKNPPKPIFVRAPVEEDSHGEADDNNDVDDDLTLKELEDAYAGGKADSDEEKDVFPDVDDNLDEPKDTGSATDNATTTSGIQFEEPEDEEEKERKRKADLLFKFMVLKRQYPNVEIPDFTDHSDLITMERVYEQVIRRVSLDSSVETYKQYLVGGFIILEWISTNWVGINMSGFSNSQKGVMNKYDRLLLELGEKNYSSLESRFPVEVRLLFLILFNAGMFYIQKNLFTGGGGDGVLGMLFGSGAPPAQSTPQSTRKNKMKGPTITPDEIENMKIDDEKEKRE